MVEYSSLTAALTTLFSSLAIVVGSFQLPTSATSASALVSAAASSHHVSATLARAAYASAPYRRPALRYLYAVGWIGGAADVTACKAALLLGLDPTTSAAQALQQTPKLLGRLRAAHIDSSQAATVVGGGIRQGCA
jgi:hypothetical protein